VPAGDLPARLAPGRAAFNRGAFFEAHELWENVWRDLAGSERTFVQGLIQIAAGLHHLDQGRPGPAARVLARGAEKLARGAPPLPIAPLLREIRGLLATLETGGTAETGRLRF